MSFVSIVGMSEFSIPVREAFKKFLKDIERLDIEVEVFSRIREIVGDTPLDCLTEVQMRSILKECRKNITLANKRFSATDERTIH